MSLELIVLDSSCLPSGFLRLALWHTLLTRLKALGPTLLLARGLMVGVVAASLLAMMINRTLYCGNMKLVECSSDPGKGGRDLEPRMSAESKVISVGFFTLERQVLHGETPPMFSKMWKKEKLGEAFSQG